MLLALVDVEYRFLWVNAGSSGSPSDAQVFNQSHLREKFENGTLVLLPPELLGEQKTAHEGRENSKLQDLEAGGWLRMCLEY